MRTCKGATLGFIFSLLVFVVQQQGSNGLKNTTCTALKEIASEQTQQECTTNGDIDCDTISCTGTFGVVEVSTTTKVLPCNEPPAVNLAADVTVGTQMYKVDETVSKSETIVVADGAANLDVTLDQLDDSIGLQVDVTGGFMVTLIEYTEIPIDTTQCSTAGVQAMVSLISVMAALMTLLLV